ncbi:hypothetical protein VI06_14520 [Aquitalea magnusonii]|nr:hypothetical protein VI06_14520 [Aquitalea magnusonii]
MQKALLVVFLFQVWLVKLKLWMLQSLAAWGVRMLVVLLRVLQHSPFLKFLRVKIYFKNQKNLVKYFLLKQKQYLRNTPKLALSAALDQ